MNEEPASSQNQFLTKQSKFRLKLPSFISNLKNKRPLLFVLAFALIGVGTLVYTTAQTAGFSGRIRESVPTISHSFNVEASGQMKAFLFKTGGKRNDNVRLVATLKDSSGNVISSAQGPTVGANVSIISEITPGTYSLTVSSVEPLTRRGTGYSMTVEYPDPQAPAPVDTVVPILSFSQPAGLVQNSFTVSGFASDEVGVSTVEYRFVGGNWIQAQGTVSWSGQLDSTAQANGDRTIEARAIDTSGNIGTTSLVVQVLNEVVVTPPPPSTDPTVPPAPAPTGSYYFNDFSSPTDMNRLAKEVHAGETVNFVASHFNGDHNTSCQGPLTTRPLVEDHTVGTHIWYCAPGGAATGHFMTGIDTTGYTIISFSPSDGTSSVATVFPSTARKICWDQNLTDLGGRKWTQLMVISEATFVANGRKISYLNPGNPDNFSVSNPQARPSGDDFTIKFLKNSLESFHGQTKVYDNFFVGLDGVTDKATRYRNCVTDNSNGTITRTQARPGGITSGTTFPGTFPAGRKVFIIGDDSYNVLKSFEEGATRYVADPFTWHWDNITIE